MKIDDVIAMLDACGLRLVQSDDRTVMLDRGDYLSLVHLANKGMRQVNTEAREQWGADW